MLTDDERKVLADEREQLKAGLAARRAEFAAIERILTNKIASLDTQLKRFVTVDWQRGEAWFRATQRLPIAFEGVDGTAYVNCTTPNEKGLLTVYFLSPWGSTETSAHIPAEFVTVLDE